jgi:two-component system, NarL family, invasion response regulator UvrY
MAIRILIADSHQHVRAALVNVILDSGENWEICCEAEDGQAAIDKVRELKPDVAILDLTMPQRDGLAVSYLIRKFSPEIPIVLLSMLSPSWLEGEAKRVGIQAVVDKSNGAELIAAIRRVLQVVPTPCKTT